ERTTCARLIEAGDEARLDQIRDVAGIIYDIDRDAICFPDRLVRRISQEAQALVEPLEIGGEFAEAFLALLRIDHEMGSTRFAPFGVRAERCDQGEQDEKQAAHCGFPARFKRA